MNFGDIHTGVVDAQLIEDLLYMLLDTSEGAYFTKDLLQVSNLLEKFKVSEDQRDSYDGIQNFVQCVYETEVATDSLKPLVKGI